MDPSEAAMPGALSLYNASGVFGGRPRPFDVQQVELRQRIRGSDFGQVATSGVKQGRLVPTEMKEVNGALLAAGASTTSCMSAAGYDVPVRRAAVRRRLKGAQRGERPREHDSACIDEGSSGVRKWFFFWVREACALLQLVLIWQITTR